MWYSIVQFQFYIWILFRLVTGRWPAGTIEQNRLSNASCLLGISKWASPIGDLVACRSELWEVGGSSPCLVNEKN